MAGTRKRRGASPPAAGETGVRARIFKWIAGITAVISLVIGVHQLVTLGGASRQRRRQVAELLSTESVQRSSGDFAGAWTSLDKAIQIDNSNSQARREQEDLAMAWLDADRPIGENQKFSDLVERVAPAVSRAAASEDRSRKADAFAHLGWADFLRSRDGVRRPETRGGEATGRLLPQSARGRSQQCLRKRNVGPPDPVEGEETGRR